MCGIFGYYTFGTPKELQAILDVLFTGLKRLEYRGYDSAGLCIDTAEAPGRVSQDGSRRASLDGSNTTSPFAASNGTPGAALDAAFAAEASKCPEGAEPVIIKCPGKIENLEKMTEQYVKDHVSSCAGHGRSTAGCAICMLFLLHARHVCQETCVLPALPATSCIGPSQHGFFHATCL